MSPKITLVVPVFNTSRYLPSCLNSIAEQTFEEFEVIVVDDVSTDDSLDILRDTVSKDKRFRLISHEANTGQGGARNTGIALSSAEYIATADSDDYLNKDMLEILFDATENETIDIVCSGFNRVREDGELIHTISMDERTVNNAENSVNIFTLLNPALWNKLVKRSLIVENSIKFPHFLNYEDLASTPRLVAKANLIKIVEDPLYNYVERENSVVTSHTPKHIHDYFQAFEILWSFLIENRLWDRYRNDFLEMVNYQLKFYLNSMLKSGVDEEFRKQHMQHILYMKLSFLNDRDRVQGLDADQLWNAITQ